MKEEYFQANQIWRSETNPERDFKIATIVNMYGDNNDTSKYVIWNVTNYEKWTEFVCRKLKVENIKQALKRENGTYPYAYAGEKSFKSMKQYIKKWNMKLESEE